MPKRLPTAGRTDNAKMARAASAKTPCLTERSELVELLLDALAQEEPRLPLDGFEADIEAFRRDIRRDKPMRYPTIYWREAYAIVDWSRWNDASAPRYGVSLLTLLANIGEGKIGNPAIMFPGDRGRRSAAQGAVDRDVP